jgi:DNA-binding PadR family transcriptional regulator
MKKTRYVILGLLQEENLSGYELKKIIDIRMTFFWQESYGQIYPELARMKEEGLIELAGTAAADKAKREKVKYRIAPEGVKALGHWMEAENEKDTIRSEFLLKMYFSTNQKISKMRKQILQFKEQSEQKLFLFRMFEQELKKDIDMHNNHRQILCVLDLGIRQAQLYADWSREMLERLDAEEK